jgi:hypothetical protein
MIAVVCGQRVIRRRQIVHDGILRYRRLHGGPLRTAGLGGASWASNPSGVANPRKAAVIGPHERHQVSRGHLGWPRPSRQDER